MDKKNHFKFFFALHKKGGPYIYLTNKGYKKCVHVCLTSQTVSALVSWSNIGTVCQLK